MDSIEPKDSGAGTTPEAPAGARQEETKRVAQVQPVKAPVRKRSKHGKQAGRNPRGLQHLPEDLQRLIDAAPEGESREQAVIRYIQEQNDLEDESVTNIHRKRGAAVQYLLDSCLQDSSEEDKRRYFKEHLHGCPYATAMGDARLYRAYPDPEEYSAFGYSNAKVLAPFSSKARLVYFNEARGDDNKSTVGQLEEVVKRHRKPKKSSAGIPEPLPEGREIGLGRESTVLFEQDRVQLDLYLPELDGKFREAINALLKRKADGAYYLPDGAPSRKNEQPAAAADRGAGGNHSPTRRGGAESKRSS
jgi:hypothetical protein